MISQLSLIVHITQSLGIRLSKVAMDVATMKHIMALGDGDDDDDDMAVDDTPQKAPSDNPPPPPPPSHPTPITHPPCPNSPRQSDAAKRGRIIKGGLNQCQCR